MDNHGLKLISALITISAITAITYLTRAAILQGNHHALAELAIATIAGLAGYTARQATRPP